MRKLTINLRRIPLLAELPDEQLAEIAKTLAVREYAKRAFVVRKGEVAESLLFLLSGHAQVVDESEDGRLTGINLLQPGAFFGEVSLIDGQPRSASIIALTPAIVGQIPKSTALHLFYNSPKVAELMLKHLSKLVRDATAFRALLGIPNAMQRLCAFLQFVKVVQPGDLHVVENLPSHQDLAIMVNTSRETVSRTISALVESGIVEKDLRRLIIRQPDQLLKLSLYGTTEPAKLNQPQPENVSVARVGAR